MEQAIRQYKLALSRQSPGRIQEGHRALTPFESRHPDYRAVAYLLGLALLRDKREAKAEAGRVLDRLFREGDTAESHLLLRTAKLGINEAPETKRKKRTATLKEDPADFTANLCRRAPPPGPEL
jgi:hypothetical protein